MHQRLYIEKRPEFSDSHTLTEQLKNRVGLTGLQQVRRLALYDLYDCPTELLQTAIQRVFSDPVSDEVREALPKADYTLVIEPLPGQFDQRADSAEQCLRLIDDAFSTTVVTSAQAWLFDGTLDNEAREKLKAHLINPIDSREKNLAETVLPQHHTAEPVSRYDGFCALDSEGLRLWHEAQGLAMTLADLQLVQHYFQHEKREPTETEIRVLDTYWSDHCRHTTFATELHDIRFPENDFGNALAADFSDYQAQRQTVYGSKADERAYTLMDLATIDAKYQRAQGKMQDVEVSAEVNACSVFIEVDEDGKKRPWLLQFKNETHNHPTEIEPFGGAATCIGGAIRDPLSGRAYVYQAMRISGSADPREAIAATLPGKLPQSVIVEGAAAGASSYGNQIGLATGKIVEYYHEGYKAKHMEVGAVVAAVPAEHVRRETPLAGDLVLLIGGATGRDGCGGATGSSRAQHGSSLRESAAEVQKGNPPEERKLQRLFRNPAFAQRIKRCNDFGAGGVAVAIGELADGLDINLDAVPVKYQGLSGTELAISESQERMAIVIAAENLEYMQALAAAENLNASLIATVTADASLVMRWQGDTIVNLKRDFLDSNGATSQQDGVNIITPDSAASPLAPECDDKNWVEALKAQLASLPFADQKGLGDRFDHSVGAACVLLPYGGRHQRTPVEGSVYALPTEGETFTASILTHGYNPNVSAWSPYHGGLLAVIEATARLVACGGDAEKAHYSLQEYFRRLGNDADNWGQPYAALLGAHHALYALERAAIGGKDSMSGSFHSLHVPPTLIAFAVATVDVRRVISPEYKDKGHQLYWLRCPQDALGRPNMSAFRANNRFLQEAIAEGNVKSIRAVRQGGILQAIYESSIGNGIGVSIEKLSDAFLPEYGGYLISSDGGLGIADNLQHLGFTTDSGMLDINGQRIAIKDLYRIASGVLADVYPQYESVAENVRVPLATAKEIQRRPRTNERFASPRVCLPVFPGTNSELDTVRAFRRNGATVIESVICNRNHDDIIRSLAALEDNLNNSQIFVLSGGFSAGDEPDGSGKFIANLLANPRISNAIHAFLERDGLILGICNGFQALVKCGLLPNGVIMPPVEGDATLTHNRIGRHIDRVATTVVANNHSPWLADFQIGEAHNVSFSHGEGRFTASDAVLKSLLKKGQVAFQYAAPVDLSPSMDPKHNPNGSLYAIEGITSPCGRILGKMGHSERHQKYGQQNYPNFRKQNIFIAGIKAFK
ncbi:MAG: phosphoribosylformylglycinamidine synthase [Cardiobacteriaceae bacterium]|nr:phosphoribosylformylglycinamidine synthase [Cardiobacteriaceae bacterium]